MFRLRSAEAIAALRQAAIEMPSDLDARAEFFVQWRARTIHLLEVIFDDDHEPARLFKEIEFSPRRLTKNEEKDNRLKLDAYLSGCAAARDLMEKLMMSLATVPAKPAEDQQPATARLKLDTSGSITAAPPSAPVRCDPEPYEIVEVAPEDLPATDEDELFQMLQRIERKLDEVLAAPA